MLKSIKSNYLPARPYNRHTSVVDLSTDFSAGNISKRKNKMNKLIIEIPEEVTRKQINSIKDNMDDLLTTDDIIGVFEGNKIQWKLSKNDGELLINIYSN